MTFFKLCGLAVCAVFVILIVKEVKRDHVSFIALSVGLLFFGVILSKFSSVLDYIGTLSDALADKTYIKALFKALGIAYITEFTREICKSCGEATIAGYVEALGKAEIIVACLPMIQELTAMALKYV